MFCKFANEIRVFAPCALPGSAIGFRVDLEIRFGLGCDALFGLGLGAGFEAHLDAACCAELDGCVALLCMHGDRGCRFVVACFFEFSIR